jgi:hypothetical protein
MTGTLLPIKQNLSLVNFRTYKKNYMLWEKTYITSKGQIDATFGEITRKG